MAIAAFGLALACLAPPPAAAADRPRLVVLIVIDGFRYDYLERFERYFAEGGFRRFMREGATFTQAKYRHATSDTCPGHAVVATGYWGNLNGIVANRWFDTERGRKVDCAAAGPAGTALNLLRPTIGDLLKQASDGKSKVIVASGKRTAAIILAGQSADAVYFPDADGRYGRLPDDRPLAEWVQALNNAPLAQARFGPTWNRILPEGAYSVVGPDDVPAESPPEGMDRTFPHSLAASLSWFSERSYHAALEQSPFGDEIVADLAVAAVREERLGEDAATDLLAISFSANDKVGHKFGPDSHEAMDTVLRTDLQLERLLDFLGSEVGLERTLVVLTADHGVASLPELAAARGIASAGRLPEETVSAAVSDALTEVYGPPPGSAEWLAFHDFPNVFLDEQTLLAAGVSVADAEAVARRAIERLPGILGAYTRSDLIDLEDATVAAPRARMALLSFRADRSGHVVYQVLPNTVAAADGTNHGSHWEYDTHVPLMWLGAGVPRGSYDTSVAPVDIAPTIRALLDLEPDLEAPGAALRPLLPDGGGPARHGPGT